MIEGIETGHEPRFDFPAFDCGIPRSYLLATVPRTGSTLLSHLLWQSGVLGAPLEYLNFEPGGPGGGASGSREKQDAIWSHALRFRTSPNGVFGVKAFPLQLEELGRFNPALLDRAIRFLLPGQGRSRVIRLRRRDTAAHAISYARAMMTGMWRKEQEDAAGEAPPVEYSRSAVERAGKLIAAQESAWDAMARDLRLEPLVLWYEDVVSAPEETLQRVAAYMDVSLDPAARVEVPKIERQSQDQASEWRRRYEGS